MTKGISSHMGCRAASGRDQPEPCKMAINQGDFPKLPSLWDAEQNAGIFKHPFSLPFPTAPSEAAFPSASSFLCLTKL